MDAEPRSQRPKGRNGVITSLNAAINAMNIAKDVNGHGTGQGRFRYRTIVLRSAMLILRAQSYHRWGAFPPAFTLGASARCSNSRREKSQARWELYVDLMIGRSHAAALTVTPFNDPAARGVSQHPHFLHTLRAAPLYPGFLEFRP